jgi:hypothetical protein
MSSMLLLKLLMILISILRNESARLDREFLERFPPISDEEFLELCSPGVNPDIALRVRQMVAEAFGVNYYCVYPSTNFAEDIGVC